MRQPLCTILLIAVLCLVLGGCGQFPEPLGFLLWPEAAPASEGDAGLLIGPGVEDEGLPGAEWGVFELMHRPAAVTAEDEPPELTDAERLEERFLWLEKKFPEGQYWNHMGRELPGGVESPFSVTSTPCAHYRYGQVYCNYYSGSMLDVFSQYSHLCQCLGFASLLSDQLFGADAPVCQLEKDAQLRPGDHVRLREYEHSVIVREVTEEGLRLAEVNAGYEDCLISWSRTFTWAQWNDLYGWDIEYIIRRCEDAAPSGSGS